MVLTSNVKSPNGRVHLAENVNVWSWGIAGHTLCNSNGGTAALLGYTGWKVTTDAVNCKTCLRVERKKKEQEFSLVSMGKDYIKQCGMDPEEYTFNEAKYKMVWGTYGKNATEPLHYKRLVDCSTNHLIAILKTQHHITNTMRFMIASILRDRKVENYVEEYNE